jgi:hypothetical protein
VLSFSLNGQSNTVNTGEFMQIVFEDIAERLPSTTNQSGEYTFKAPIIEEYEFRTETNDFDLDNQDYLIRVSPTTKAIREAQERIFEGYLAQPKDNPYSLELDFIEDAYNYWIDEYFSAELHDLLEQQKLILEDKMTVIKKQLIIQEADFSDFVKAQNDLKELNLNQLQNLQENKMYAFPISLNSAEYTFEDLISIEEIKSFVTSFDPSTVEDPDRLVRDNLKRTELQNELDLEEAEAKQILRFAEISYGGPHSDPFREKVSVGVGLRFPWDGGNRLDMEEIKIEMDNIENEAQFEQDKLFLEVSRSRFEVLESIRLYEEQLALRESMNEYNMELKQILNETNNSNPTFILELNQQSVKLQIDKINSQKDVYEEYLDFLEDSLLMTQMPLKNYLLASN